MKVKLVGLAAACGLLVLLVALRFAMNNRSLEAIRDDYAAGDLSAVVAQVANLSDADLDAQLLVANCLRQLGQNQAFVDAIEQLRLLAGPQNPQIDLVMALYRIQHGQLDQPPLEIVQVLQSAGAQAGDAWSAAVQGTLALGRLEEAQLLLDRWEIEEPNSPQLAFVRGGYLNVRGRPEAAEEELMRAIEGHPRHELSWLALAELYSRPPNVRFRQAERVLDKFLVSFPDNAGAHLRLSRIKRRLGKGKQALSLLSSRPATNSGSDDASWERTQIEFDLGNHATAQDHLSGLQMASPADLQQWTDEAFRQSLQGRMVGENGLNERVTQGAMLLAFNGDLEGATAVFAVANDRAARLRRLQDLEVQQMLAPRGQSITDEINAVLSPAYTPNYPTLQQLNPRKAPPVDAPPGMPIYVKHCAACHGHTGGGDGWAGSNLVPAPRNFLAEPLRIVSASNGLATDQDIAGTIRRGQPGTSMPAFEQLTNTDVELLVDVVEYFRRQGLRDTYVRRLAIESDAGLSDAPQAVEAWITARSDAGEPLVVPQIKLDEQNAARGQQLFDQVGCRSCHPVDGDAPHRLPRLFDSLGRPLAPVDLAEDAFHGGSEPGDVYKRLVLGIPGTPHPAVTSLSEIDLQCLVAYVVSVHTENVRSTTNFERGLRAHAAAPMDE